MKKTINKTKDIHRLLSLADLEGDGNLEDREFQVLRTGEFYDPRYGKFAITNKMLTDLKANFDSGVLGVDVALDIGHEPEKGASAWIKELSIKSNGLWAKFKDFTPAGKDSFLSKAFKYFSVEVDEFIKVVNGKKETIKNVLRGIALTNRPVIKGMQPTFFSEEANQEINKGSRPKSNMNAVMLFAENLLGRAKVSKNDLIALKTMVVSLEDEDEKKEVEEKVEEVEAKAEADATAEAKAGEDGKEGEAKLAETTAKLTLAEKKLKEIEKQEATRLAETAYEGLILSEANMTGFARPAAEKAGLKAFVGELTSDQRTKFSEIVKEVQTVDSAKLTEIGHAKAKETGGKTEEEQKLAEVDTKAAEYQKQGMTLAEAVIRAQKEIFKV